MLLRYEKDLLELFENTCLTFCCVDFLCLASSRWSINVSGGCCTIGLWPGMTRFESAAELRDDKLDEDLLVLEDFFIVFFSPCSAII